MKGAGERTRVGPSEMDPASCCGRVMCLALHIVCVPDFRRGRRWDRLGGCLILVRFRRIGFLSLPGLV